MYHTEFLKGTPSVFVVSSPFQTLCAIATIRQLEIEDYQIIIVLYRNDVRNNQIVSILERYKIRYNIRYRGGAWLYKYMMMTSIIQRHSHYKRLFVGDPRSYLLFFIGCRYVSDNSNVVCLDDGNITLCFLSDRNGNTQSHKRKWFLKLIYRWRGLEFGNCFLTIYGDIPNRKYSIQTLYLSNVVKGLQLKNTTLKNIYIVGTYLESYCKPLNIDEGKFINKLGELMQYLRKNNPNDIIYYISHGREDKDYGERLCKYHGCFFIRPKMIVELELLSMANPPKAIYGYTSSALYNLKKMFPMAQVFNILFELKKENHYYRDYVVCSDYYKRNGIDLIIDKI